MKTTTFLPGLLGVIWGASACASTPAPKELVDAREGYSRISTGEPSKLIPAEVLSAKQALDEAEKAYADQPSAPETVDLSYVAHRKMLYVEAKSGTTAAQQSQTTTKQTLEKLMGQMTDKQRAELSQAQSELTREQQARQSAEKSTKDSIENAARLAAAKEGSRPTTLTLNGSVVFPAGAATLLPAAQEKLTQVAQTLKEQEKQAISVEGHTDSSAQEKKGDLASKRAQAVKEYLVSRGIASDRITTSSVGSARPLADNKSAEGRANNRRVEITLKLRLQ